MRKTRDFKGITLIALVVTIIILLILAGISITMLSGQNGILSRAADAKKSTGVNNEEEQVKLAVNAAITDGIGTIDEEQLKSEITNVGLDEKNLSKDGTQWIYEGEYKTYIIVSTGEIQAETEVVAPEEGEYTLALKAGDNVTAYLIEENTNTGKSEDVQEIEKTASISIGDTTTTATTGLDTSKKYELRICGSGEMKSTSQWTSLTEGCEYKGTAGISLSLGYESIEMECIDKISIADGITTIGYYAFYGCENVKNIRIPRSVTSIESYAFYDCMSLESITIPSSVTSIGPVAFAGCTSLTNITIPSSVTSIAGYTFSDCSSLVDITIPSNVTSIGSYAFGNCSSLVDVTFEKKDGWKVKKYDNYLDFDNKTNATNIDVSSDLIDSSKAANYLKNTYCDHFIEWVNE